MRLSLVAGSVTLTLAVSNVVAHHSVISVYDMETTVELEGIVREWELSNPHGTVLVDVTNDAGETEVWRIEMPGILSLSRRGWTDQTISVGDRLVVSGSPSRLSRPGLFWRKFTLEDGTELLAPGDEDVQSLEEQRRQRILEAQSSYGFLLEIIPGHYRYENGNRVAGVIVTDEGAVVLDGLSNPEMGQDVRAKVLAATGQPVRYLVNSTFHNNYTRGNAAYTDVVSIGHEFYREDLVTLMEENGASAEERASRLPKMTFTENMTLYLGGKEIQIIHIGPAHTRGDSIMYVPEDRIVYVSELIFYNQFPFYNSGYIGWIDAIDRILAMDVDIFVPGQGPMTYDDPRESRDKFLAIRQILVDARDGVQAQIAQGATEEEVLQNVTLEQYAYVGDAFEAQSQVMLSRMYRELVGTLE